MAKPHVITALRKKRAELAGEVVTADLRLGKLRDDLDAIDRTLPVFDPHQHPEKIRPVIKRNGDKLFAYGECKRDPQCPTGVKGARIWALRSVV